MEWVHFSIHKKKKQIILNTIKKAIQVVCHLGSKSVCPTPKTKDAFEKLF